MPVIRSKTRNGIQTRKAVVMVLFALVLPCLVTLLALIIDGGIVMANHRRLQSTADTIALTVSSRLIRNQTVSECMFAAEKIRTVNYQETNALAWNGGTVDAINNPPLSGPFAGNPKFVEVVLSAPFSGFFSGLMNTPAGKRITTRSVAGMESNVTGEGVITLDPCKIPGMEVSGGANLIVAGATICNSGGAGYDQSNNWVDLGYKQYSSSVSNNGTLKSELSMVRGGVDSVENFQNIVEGGPNPLYANIRTIFPDPYHRLPIPVPSNTPSITDWKTKKSVGIGTGEVVTLTPGIYSDIRITGSPNVTFAPGTYILSPTNPNQGLVINGSPTIVGNNVLFYFTGSNYLQNSPGYWDILDGAVDGPLPPSSLAGCTLPPPPDSQFNRVYFSTLDINLNDANVTLNGITDTASPFHNFLFYARRRNTSNVQIQSNAGSSVNLKGSIYAKWADFKVAGGGRFQSQFTVGTLTVTGIGNLIIEKYDRKFDMAGFIYLVE